jgi:hypothetical protein
VRSAFKILVILTQSDNSNIEFLMNIGIAEFISEALGWNDPSKQGGTTSLVIEFDTYMNGVSDILACTNTVLYTHVYLCA